MANYSITAIIGAVTDKLKKGLDSAVKSTKNYADKSEKSVGKVTKAGNKAATSLGGLGTAIPVAAIATAAVAAGKQVVDFGVSAVKTAGDIEGSMNEVFTLLPGITAGAKEQMTAEMMELSAEMGKMPHDVINSLYNALSAGVPQDNVFDFLKTASQASIAGVSSTEEAVGALTTVLNGYKKPASEAGEVSDALFTIIKNGVTTMPELAANIGKVTPIAASLGISFDEVGAAFAEMTKNLGPGKSAETGTQLKAFFSEISKAGSVAAKAFERISGKSFPDFIAGGGTVSEALQMMAKDAKENNTRITDMFGSIEAGQAALILSTDNAKGFNEQLGEMAKKSGATEEAFNTVDQGFSRMMEKLMVGLEAIKFAIGKALGPVVDSLMPTLLKGLKMIGNLPWNSVGEVLGEIMKSFEPLMEVLFELVKELFPLLPPLIKMAARSTLALIPLATLILNILVKIIPILVFIVDWATRWLDVIFKVWEWTSRLINAAFKGGEAVKTELDEIGKEAGGLWEKILGWFGEGKGLLTKVLGWFQSFWGWISETIETVSYAAKMFWTIVSWPFRQIGKLAISIFDLLVSLLDLWWTNVKENFSMMLDLVKGFFSWVRERISKAFNFYMGILKRIKDKIFEMFPWLEDLINWALDVIITFWKEVYAQTIGRLVALKDFIFGIGEKLLNFVKDVATEMWLMIKERVEEIKEKIMTSNSEIAEAIRFLWFVAEEVFNSIISLVKKAIGLFDKAAKAVGWLAKKLGLAKEETGALNDELEETDTKQKAVKKSTDEITEAKAAQAAVEDEILGTNREQLNNARAQFAQQEEKLAAVTATKLEEEATLAVQQGQNEAGNEYLKIAAEKVLKSKVHTGQLAAAIEKHEELNSVGEAYKLIADGEKTPQQIIAEAFGEQVLLNAEGQKYSIQDANGQTPSEQISSAIDDQSALNAEALNNPLLQMKNGELKVSCDSPDYTKHLDIFVQQLALIHRDLLGIDKTLKGKFVNQ